MSHQTPLERLLQAAKAAGVARDQVSKFLSAGYIPQPKQLQYHGDCRLADVPGGPTKIALGGARGPGKSHASFAQVALDDCQRCPELRVLFLRKVGKAAKESFEALRQRVLRHVEHEYRSHANLLSFPNGSFIIVGNFLREDDIEKYIGLEYDVIVIEEATQLSEMKVNMLLGSLRTSKPNWRPRLYLTTNPGGIGHQWFKKWFVLPWRRKRERDTRFIPANWKDNKFLNETYITYLAGLRGVLARMWREGDWDVGAGQYFVHWDEEAHTIEPFVIPHHWPLWAGMDYGFSHPTAVYWFTKSPESGRVYTVAEHVQARWLVPQHAEAIKLQTLRLGYQLEEIATFVAGHDVFARKDDTTGKTVADQYKDHLGIELRPARIDRPAGAAYMLKQMGNLSEHIPPSWQIFTTCTNLIECLPNLQSNPNRPEDVLKVDANEDGEDGDDPYDAARYGLMEAEFLTSGKGFATRY